MDIGKAVRVALAERDKTRTWLAGEMGVTRAYISAITKGKCSVSISKANQIADIFGLTLSDFVKLGE